METVIFLSILLGIGVGFILAGFYVKWRSKPTRKPTQSDSERIDKLRKDIKEMSDNIHRMDDIMNKPK
jgi:MFS superfamily sulfate permease-like transporter